MSGPCPACGLQNDAMGDYALGCVRTSIRIARHNLLRDVLFDSAVSAALGPVREEKNLLPGRTARPGDMGNYFKKWKMMKIDFLQ